MIKIMIVDNCINQNEFIQFVLDFLDSKNIALKEPKNFNQFFSTDVKKLAFSYAAQMNVDLEILMDDLFVFHAKGLPLPEDTERSFSPNSQIH